MSTVKPHNATELLLAPDALALDARPASLSNFSAAALTQAVKVPTS